MTDQDDRRLFQKQRSVDLHFRLPAKHYDELDARAREMALTVPQWLRWRLRDILKEPRDSQK